VALQRYRIKIDADGDQQTAFKKAFKWLLKQGFLVEISGPGVEFGKDIIIEMEIPEGKQLAVHTLSVQLATQVDGLVAITRLT
jgi:hypothetical protein